MKLNKILVSLLSAGVLVSPVAYATNGDEMMAVGSQNTALGGTGVANYVGADSAWANPAMLAKSKGSELTGGVNFFTPKVSNNGLDSGVTGRGTDTGSKTVTNYIPDVSFSSRVNDSLTYGLAVAGIAGMGVDYKSSDPHNFIQAKSALSILRVMPTIAYNDGSYGVAFSPIYQQGSLMLSYNTSQWNSQTGGPVNAAESADSSSNFGYAFGGYFDVMTGMTVAASYQSEIAAQYGNQLHAAGVGFGVQFGNDLNQPAEGKVGVAYQVAEGLTLTADYKVIQWGSAAGYKDFNWVDQNVAAIGAKYSANGYWLGLGYNNANNPITKSTSATKGTAINFFNNMFFPATVQNSYTLGGGFDISKSFAIEGAAVITPSETTNIDATAYGKATNTTTHSQQSISASLRYKF